MNYNIVGTVQNVDDYVEIYAQGDNTDIERFIQGVIEGALTSINVTSHQLEELRPKSKIIGFSINIKC